MPNGVHGSERDWKRLESPLVELDPALDAYASRHGLTLSRNYHSWPQRALTWGDEITRSVHVYLANEADLTLTVWAVAWQDHDSGRHWKNQVIRDSVLASQLQDGLSAVLDRAVQIVNSWNRRDLEPVT
jgi:hypothetical protein